MSARLVTTWSTQRDDDFTETMALIEVAGPLPPLGDREPGEVLLALAGPLVPEDVELAGARAVENEDERPPTLVAHWTNGERVQHLAVASSGATHSLIVMEVQASEASLYASTFDTLVEGLEGIAAPVHPFPLSRWRWATFWGWLSLAGAVGSVLRITMMRSIGWILQIVAVICVGCAIAAGAAVFLGLSDRMHEMELAATSPMAVATETAFMGAVVAGLALAGAVLLRTRQRPVKSAPADGIYASRSQSSMRIPVVPKSELRPGDLDSSHGTPIDAEAAESADTVIYDPMRN